MINAPGPSLRYVHAKDGVERLQHPGALSALTRPSERSYVLTGQP